MVVHPREHANLTEDDPVIVDFGCGRNKHPNATLGIDGREDTEADIVHDLSTGVPLPTESVDKAFAFDVLEHISDGIVDFVTEVHRVLKPGAGFVVLVPHENEDPPETNPHHVRSFRQEWFWSWDPKRGEHVKWDNWTCVPFDVEETDRIFYDEFPQRFYKIRSREFTMTKIVECSRHPTVSYNQE